MRDHTLGAFYKKMSDGRQNAWGVWLPSQFCISVRELGWRNSGEVLERLIRGPESKLCQCSTKSREAIDV
jgi:hypothetical protein